jgi:hypothetical protein
LLSKLLCTRLMGRSLLALVSAAILAVAAIAAHPPAARADTGSYNLIFEFLQPGTWTGWYEPLYDETNYYMTYAWAAYEGAGSAAVCEQVQRLGDAGWITVSSQCGTNQAWSGNLWQYRTIKRIRVKNDSPNAHTIKGYYSWSY